MMRNRSRFYLSWIGAAAVAASAAAHAQQSAPVDGGPFTGSGAGGGARVDPGRNLMANPYRLVESWPTLTPGMRWGAAINFLPDDQGGTWALLRTEPPIVYFTAAGTLSQHFGEGVFVQAHGLCRDK